MAAPRVSLHVTRCLSRPGGEGRVCGRPSGGSQGGTGRAPSRGADAAAAFLLFHEETRATTGPWTLRSGLTRCHQPRVLPSLLVKLLKKQQIRTPALSPPHPPRPRLPSAPGPPEAGRHRLPPVPIRRPETVCVVRCGFRPSKSRCLATCVFTPSDGKCHPGQPSHLPPDVRISAAEYPCCPVPRDLPHVQGPSGLPRVAGLQWPPQQIQTLGFSSRPSTSLPGRDAPLATHLPQVPGSRVAPMSTGSGKPSLSRGAQATASPAGGWGEVGSVGRAPGFGRKHPRSGGALSKPPSSAAIPRPPLDACRELLIEFTLVKNVNKLQMTS